MADKEDTTRHTPVHNADEDTRSEGVEDIRTQLAEHIGDLRFLNSALMTCVQALQQQDAEMDADSALVLQRTVGDKLDATIDCLEAIALGVELEEEAA